MRPYQLPDTATPVDETFTVMVDDASLPTPEKLTITDLTAQSEARATAVANGAITGSGLDAGTGAYTPDDTTNYIRTADFATAGLAANLFNADKLLDLKIQQTQNIGSKYYTVTLTSSQILNLKGTPVLVLPSPGVGYFNHVKVMFYKLNFTTTAYTLPGIGAFELHYDNGTDNLCNIPSVFLEGRATEINYNNSVAHCEAIANEAIYLKSTFASELTNGDSTLSLIIEYETLADFSVISTPPVQANCLQYFSGTFVNADLTALGNLEITHNLNSDDIASLVIIDNTGTAVAVTFALGDETGANTLNVITVPIGLGIAGTWTYALIVNIC
jgi:hypothetical protein